MAKGYKTGGRRRGTPNKLTQERDVRARLEALDCDPLEGMVRLAQDQTVDAAVRGRMFSELAQYCYAKRRSLEHEPLDVNLSVAP
jgi:hypothetical protein